MAIIQWYPGHMAKAKREFQEKLQMVDVVLELIDARVPHSSTNPMIDELVTHKPRVKVLMKSDLADPKVTQEWLNYYNEQGYAAVAIDAKHNQDMKTVLQYAKQALEAWYDKRKEKGLQDRAIRAVSVGIPNVGKSTLINRFAGKNIAQTGNRPGVTKQQQWIKYKNQLELLDTPGILWPKFEDQEIGMRLAVTGAIKDTLLHLDDIVLYAMEYFIEHYPGRFEERYKLNDGDETAMPTPELLLKITEKRGFRDDYERAAEMIIHEIRKGMLGRFTLETPVDIKKDEEANDASNN